MDTWKSDRIYNWLGAAIAHNSTINTAFYFDFSDKTFFALIENKKRYVLDDNNTLSAEEKDLLISKINKVANNDASLLEIKKSRKDYSHLFDQTTSYENYTKREKQWVAMYEEIKVFLTTHSISIYEATLLE